MNVLEEKTHRNVDPISDFAVFCDPYFCLWCLIATIYLLHLWLASFYQQFLPPTWPTCGFEHGLAPKTLWNLIFPTGRVWTRVCFSRSTRSDESRSGPRRAQKNLRDLAQWRQVWPGAGDLWHFAKWVCLKIGYIPNYSHLIGIMIINHWV